MPSVYPALNNLSNIKNVAVYAETTFNARISDHQKLLPKLYPCLKTTISIRKMKSLITNDSKISRLRRNRDMLAGPSK
jgi:hypothetical protein